MRNVRKKICVVTGCRAEYGILYWLLREIKKDPGLQLQVIATGMHLEKKFGFTYKKILNDGFKIDARVDMELKDDTEEGVTRSAGLGIIGFSRAYRRLKPDVVVLSGDKFEILAAASAALLSRIPIAHIHGGEITEGAYDDPIRHAVTKMATIHFVAHRDYARRIIQMGEDRKFVFNYGAPGLDNIKRSKLLDKEKLENELGVKLGRDTALATFHPVTMEKGKASGYIRNLVKALDDTHLKVIFTMPNADPENKVIFREIERYVKKNPKKARAFKSLGQEMYLSLMKYTSLMVGNSSSGIVESPSFRLPVVNIGIRQKGRLRAKNVIDSKEDYKSIRNAIDRALSRAFVSSLNKLKNPFGNGTASKRIKDRLKVVNLHNHIKKFKDIT